MKPHGLLIASGLLLGTLGANAQLVINEVDYDQPGTDGAEYLELLNTGSFAYPLQYVQVVLVNGSNGGSTPYATLSNVSWPALDPGAYFVICANSAATANCDAVVTPATNLIQNGVPDAIALVMTQPVPTVIDAVSYGGDVPGYTEGSGALEQDSNLAPDLSIGRYPDGTDTDDNNADFRRMCSTPGAANIIDPLQCQLNVGVEQLRGPSPAFVVLPGPGGEHLLVFDANPAGEEITFEVFAADGSLLGHQRMGTAKRASWSFPIYGSDARILLVRVSTPTRQQTRKVALL